MKELTIQQKKVLQCIKFYIKKTGFPPTRADICRELGFKSPNAAESHLRALEKKGYITIENGASRGINLTENLIIPYLSRFYLKQYLEHVTNRFSNFSWIFYF